MDSIHSRANDLKEGINRQFEEMNPGMDRRFQQVDRQFHQVYRRLDRTGEDLKQFHNVTNQPRYQLSTGFSPETGLGPCTAEHLRRILGTEAFRSPSGEGTPEPQTMPAMTAPVTRYTPQDAARILGIQQSQVMTWQRAGLVSAGTEFSLRDLRGMQRLRDLRHQRISVKSIQRSVLAMQRIAGLADPMHEGVPVSSGPRLVFRHGGALLDPLTQQLGFDFDTRERGELSLLKREHSRENQSRAQARAQELFQHAVQLEEKPGTVQQAAALYAEILSIWPRHAPASINLGTIHYNAQRFSEAEQCYRTAAEIDPDYALAFFDLGNVLDELRRLPEAIAAYRRAIQLVANYADAHYNLALAYERTGERRRALRHWMHYLRLDPVGPWATHARSQAKRTMASEKLSIVTRGGKLAG